MLLNDVTNDTLPPPLLSDDFPVDQRKCRLLGPTALVVQALMGVFVILSLVYKRQRETRKRPWRIWMFDVSKQLVGQMFVHGVNLLISGIGAHHSSGNPCAVYFLNILIDTTLGVGIIYFIHRLLTHIFSDLLELKGFKSGQYGSPPSVLFWLRQAAVYVTALTTMKLLVIGLFAIWPGIFRFGDWLLSWTGGGDAIQVIFVMGLFPIAMNVLQFWLIDSIVKAGPQDDERTLGSSPRHSEDREPLVNGDEHHDNENYSHTIFDVESQRDLHSNIHIIDDNETVADEEMKKASSSKFSTISQEDGHAYPPLSSSQRSHSSIDSNRSQKETFSRSSSAQSTLSQRPGNPPLEVSSSNN